MATHRDQWADMVGSEPPYVSLARGYNIRLVELLPGNDEDVSIRLWIHGLGHAPSYEAISYVWGNPNNKVPIECNGKELPITRNLEAALRRMRYQDRSRMLWADAICINQDKRPENKEKAHHVGFMDKVYRRADRVLVQMPASANARTHEVGQLITEHGIRLNGRRLQDMTPVADDDPILQDERWSSLRELLNSEWFGRTWVLQETGVARDPVVLYGNDEFSYRDLMRLLRWITKCASQLLGRYSISYTSIHTEWEDWTADWRSVQDYRYSAVDLLSHAKGLGCTEPRDRIYAFLGHPLLRSEDDKPILLPSYEEDYTVLDLYTDFTRNLLSTETGIKALSAVEHDQDSISEASVPSWTIRWTMDIIWNSMGYYELFYYRASGQTELKSNIRIDEDRLVVEGVLVDAIDSVFAFSEHETDWPSVPAVQALTSNNDLTALLMRVTKAAFANDRQLAMYHGNARWDALSLSLCTGLTNYERAEDDLQQHQANFAALWHLLISIYEEHDANKNPLKDTKPPASQGGSADRFYDDILLACKGRSFFITKQGYFGLGPLITKPQDRCFVLKGARVPFILRTTGEGAQRLVGECYIHGIMEGSFVSGSDVSWQDLIIV